MTTLQKRRAAKLRRGAHQVLPLIAKLARKYAVQAPGASDDMESNIAYAQSLEPILGAVGVLHGTLGDAHLSAQSSAWKTGTVSYGMLKQAAKANVNLASELEPVTEWFRQKAKGGKSQGETTETTTAAPSAKVSVAQAQSSASVAKPSEAAAATPTATTPAST